KNKKTKKKSRNHSINKYFPIRHPFHSALIYIYIYIYIINILVVDFSWKHSLHNLQPHFCVFFF
ncbi:MAG: hypothetical protein MCS20_01785, partial [Candidatus Phytoplasma mali]|nr:hypothetical protein [Candidatus Phytoplasma australiense]MBZ7920119.1 hypothetical protein [Candidatus Karelsulcia muelleri]MCG7202123.1 hypothetical protein [Candidatus Phytoplasma mali]MCZ8632613.1 hypothetical protein [Spiroplasma sp. Tabriz.8]